MRFRFYISFLAVLAGMSPVAKASVKCQSGATVDVESRCAYFAHFGSEDNPPDARIARNLGVKTGEFARSIAVVVAISEYKNPAFNLPAAKIDARNLEQFLTEDQKFDEVILLENQGAAIENIRYFLRTYTTQRAAFYRGKVRFLFAFSGHGVPVETVGDISTSMGVRPSVGFALANAVDDHDLENIYGLNELRPLLTDLAKNTYQSLALINACYGGDVFGLALSGGDPNDMESRSSSGITAGPADYTVISLGEGRGSLFFETLINGVESGEADPDARKVTLGLAKAPKEYYGIVRLGPLDTYISTQIEKAIETSALPTDDLRGNDHHWSGPIVPDGMRSLGGFFFLQHPPIPLVTARGPASRTDGCSDLLVHGQASGGSFLAVAIAASAYVACLHVGTDFSPSLNQIAISPKREDGFGRLRELPGEKRGVDVSHYSGPVDWGLVAKDDIQFAYIRSTQSASLVDRMFSNNWREAKTAGVARGAYHYFSFCDSPEAQLENIRHVVPVDPDSLPIAIAVELWAGQNQATIPSLAKEGACADQLGSEGIKHNLTVMINGLKTTYSKLPVIYGNDYLMDSVLGRQFTDGVTLWKLGYGVRQAPKPPWTLWQFTNNERVDGIKGRADVNVLSETVDLEKLNR